MSNTMIGNIAGDLATLATDISTLTPLPGNPRIGDVEAVKRSYQQFGQLKPIVARKQDRTVIAGNHQLTAARELGWTHLAVVFTDADDATAKAFALADNRTADLGTYDDDLLARLLEEIQANGDTNLLAATGYDDNEIARLLGQVEEPELNTDPALGGTQYRIVVECADEAQQRRLLEQLEGEGIECKAVMT